MPFEKGREKTGGRQMGTPNQATAEFKEFWQQFFESEEYRENLKTRLLAGRADHMERYAAELLYGRPRQEIGIRGQDGTVIIVDRFGRLKDLVGSPVALPEHVATEPEDGA